VEINLITNQHRDDGLDLVVDVHVPEVLDLAVHRSRQENLLVLVREVLAQFDRQHSSGAFLLVVKVQAGLHAPFGMVPEVHGAAEEMETSELLVTEQGLQLYTACRDSGHK